jgi:hypothetical protein
MVKMSDRNPHEVTHVCKQDYDTIMCNCWHLQFVYYINAWIWVTQINLYVVKVTFVGRNNSGSIATRYGLDDRRIEPR